MDLAVGDVVADKYRIDAVLGRGGMGMVVAATHLVLMERVALKFLLADETAETRGRFLREARALVKLKSEHAVRVLDVGEIAEVAPYIVMEYLEGTDLSRMKEQRGPLPIAEAAEYILQACDAIAEAHALGIIHRDVKLENLFVAKRPDGTPLVKVLDFGISKAAALADPAVPMTNQNVAFGTPWYMSPEQMLSAAEVDPRSDVWSLGVCLFELVSGTLPFEGKFLGQVMSKVFDEPPPRLEERAPHAPPELCALVASCLEKDVGRRCPSVAHLAEQLAPFAPERARPIASRVRALLGTSEHALTIPRMPARPHSLPPSPFLRASPDVAQTLADKVQGRRYDPDMPTRGAGPRPLVVFGLLSAAAIMIGLATAVVIVLLK